MNKERAKKTNREKRTERLSIRITPSQRDFIYKEGYSITAIFDEALRDLGYKGGTRK